MGSIRSNGYFHDPALAQAFENLGAIFAPPSGSDASGFAAALAKRQEAARLQQVYELANSPNYDKSAFDRSAIGAGLYAPSSSYYSVDENNATTRRGQDTVAQTALRTNMNDVNQRDRANVNDNQTKFAISRFGQPLSAGQVLPDVPDAYAQRFSGLPGALPAERGVVSVNPGEQANLPPTVAQPQGQVISGTPKPLSFDEWRAQQAIGAQSAGKIPDNTLMSIITGTTNQAPVQAIDPVTKQPRFMNPQTAVDTGAAPYDKPSAPRAPDIYTYRMENSDGSIRVGSAAPDENGVLHDTQTREVLPPNTPIAKVTVAATSLDNIGKQTEAQQKNSAFSLRGDQANTALEGILNSGYRPSAVGYEGTQGVIANRTPLSFANWLVANVDPKAQEYQQAGLNFLNSILRPDTGAAFSDQEKNDYARVFLPLPSDTEATIKAKEQARHMAVAVTSANSAGGAQAFAQQAAALGLPVPSKLITNLKIGSNGATAPGTGTASNNTPNKPIPMPAPGGQAVPVQAQPMEAQPANPQTGVQGSPDNADALRNAMSKQLPRVTDPEVYRTLPSGTHFVAPDGSTRIKP